MKHLIKAPLQTLNIGPDHLQEQAPEEISSITVENCHHVELHSGLLDHMLNLQNVNISSSRTVVVHSKLYSRTDEKYRAVDSLEFTKINRLQVKRFAFKDLEVTNRLFLSEVRMATVMSLAFDLHYVKDFSIFKSKFDRISMFGIKVNSCNEFNVLGDTYFGTLAAHAIKLKADKFWIAFSWFGHLHDSSFDIQYSLCDIQGNTFNSLAGKPFINLRPTEENSESNETRISGLIFRENKFVSEPMLPLGSLAMPSFDLLVPEYSIIDIDSNLFPCSCLQLDWFLIFGEFGQNSKRLEVEAKGSLSFVQQLYKSAGNCLVCDAVKCEATSETLKSYSESELEHLEDGQIKCKGSMMSMKSPGDNNLAQSYQKKKEAKDASKEENSHVIKNAVDESLETRTGKSTSFENKRQKFDEMFMNGGSNHSMESYSDNHERLTVNLGNKSADISVTFNLCLLLIHVLFMLS